MFIDFCSNLGHVCFFLVAAVLQSPTLSWNLASKMQFQTRVTSVKKKPLEPAGFANMMV